MKYFFFLFSFFFYLSLYSVTNDYTKEPSWQERKQYAKKIINLFINKK